MTTPGTRVHRRITAALFVASMVMIVLDTTIVNVALPAISRDFGVEIAASGTISVGYLVSLAVVMPAAAWLGDRYGTKRMFLVGLATFTFGSMLCGLATSLGELVAFRILQGVGGGLLLPLGTTLLFRAYTADEQIRAAKLLMLPTALAPATGPLIGGAIVDGIGWRWIFFLNVPIGVLTFAGAWLLLEEHRERPSGRFDLPGFVCAGVGLGSLMYAISRGSAVGWGSPQIVAALIAGTVLSLLLVRVELRTPEPMLRIGMLRDSVLRTVMATALLAGAVFAGSLYLAPLMLQDGLGFSAFQSGLTTFPEAIGVMLGSQVVSYAFPRVGARPLLVGGFTGLVATSLLLASTSASTDRWTLRVLLLAMGISAVNVHLPSQGIVFGRTKRADTGHASSLYNANRRFGAAMGVAIFSSVLAAAGSGNATGGTAPLGPYHDAFLAAALLALVGVPFALRAPARAAAAAPETMPA